MDVFLDENYIPSSNANVRTKIAGESEENTIAIICGIVPGLYVGRPVIMGIKDDSQFNELADNIKRQFVKDYIIKNKNQAIPMPKLNEKQDYG